MVYKVFCDGCGQEIKSQEEPHGYIDLSFKPVNDIRNINKSNYDLCIKCMEKLNEVLKCFQ